MKFAKLENEKLPIGKIVCLGRNYSEHIKEMGHEKNPDPVIFLKTTSSIIYSGESVIKPESTSNLHYEVELVLLIGNTIRNADDEQADLAILGYSVGLDMTCRDLQSEAIKKDEPWTLSKCFDTSAVISDILPKFKYKMNGKEKIQLSLNNKIKQSSTLDKMILNPIEVVKFISSKMTLEPGDLIFTGTPEGVGQANIGDEIFASIENIGELETNII
ncbi:MAG: fumarylacetoacetate hydrolase family protein [Ignavibacteriales bacterium]|nr:fumarylacetoacetate hydrolase family protein [Ignavibacteriales bacterium]